MKNSKNKEIVLRPILPKNKVILLILFSRFLLYLPPLAWIIRRYLRSCQDITFRPGFRFFYGNLHAKNAYLGDTFFMDYAPIYIGSNTKFSFENMVITGSHKQDDFETVVAQPVTIGKNVWVTTRCIILPGVTIGDNCVIAAGSVVAVDIPPNSLAAGNPARVIKTFNTYSKKPS